MKSKQKFTFCRAALLCVLVCLGPETLRFANAQVGKQIQEKIPGVPEGYTIIEGDIQAPIELVNAMRSGVKSKTNAPDATFRNKLWPNGIVPFLFQNTSTATSSCAGAPLSGFVSAANQTAMRSAMATIEAGANIHFQLCPNSSCGNGNPPHILIRDSTNDTTAGPNNACQDASANNSPVGYQGRGQTLNITSWTGADSQGIIMHELLHALGFEHEQSRPDRDNFITPNCANIQGDSGDCKSIGARVNFGKADDAFVYGPYDFDSLMHYNRCSFSIDCPPGSTCNCTRTTLDVKAPYNSDPRNWQANMGQRSHLSDLDRLTLKLLYTYPDYRFVDGAYRGQWGRSNGTLLRPYQSLATGINATPVGGVLWIQPGTYFANSLTKTIHMRAPLGGVDLRALQGIAGDTLATVSAASYNGELSSESIAVAFGEKLASETATAASLPLPTALGGVTVKLKDSADVERDAPLFFVSPGQINYLVPAGASVGPAAVSVYKNGVPVANTTVPVTETAPGVFTADSSGQGAPAAIVLRIRGEEQFIEALTQFDETLKQFVPIPIDLGPEGDQVFLILFGTGFRPPGPESSVTAMIGEERADVLFAGGVAGFAGLDQANVRLPRSLAGKGEVSVLLIADNRSANAVRINVR